jgi:uroporphyrinogen decarboxylase
MEMMNPRETILRAFDGRKADRIPAALIGAGTWSVHHFGTSFKELSTDAPKMAGMIIEMSERLRSDIVYVGSGYPNFLVAALGGKIKCRDIGTPDLEAPIVSSEKDLAKLDISQIERDRVLQTIREAYCIVRAKLGEEYIIALTAWGPFTLGARLIGEEVMMKALYKAPSFVERVTSFAAGMLMRFYEPLLSSGMLDVILLGEPTASGDLISRKQFEQFVLPRIKEFTGWAKMKGAHTIIHTCGNTADRLDLYPLTGASCISLDHKTDIAKAKKVLHGKMCFAGNVDPVKVLLQGTAQEVEDACRGVIKTAGTDGGFILMPGCDIPPTVPYENIQKFMRTAWEWKE